MLVGDSYAAAMAPAVAAAMPDARFVRLMRSSCPAIEIAVNSTNGPYPACDEYHQLVNALVAEIRPDVLVMENWWGQLLQDRLVSGATDEAALTEWADALGATIQRWSPSVGAVRVIASTPGGADLTDCATPVSVPADCISQVRNVYTEVIDAEAASVASLSNPAVTYIRTRDWVCSTTGSCPSFINNTPVYIDSGHLTDKQAESLAPLLAPELVG